MPTTMTTRIKAFSVAAVLGVGGIVGAACGDDDDSPTNDGVTDGIVDDGGTNDDGLDDGFDDDLTDDDETTTTM